MYVRQWSELYCRNTKCGANVQVRVVVSSAAASQEDFLTDKSNK